MHSTLFKRLFRCRCPESLTSRPIPCITSNVRKSPCSTARCTTCLYSANPLALISSFSLAVSTLGFCSQPVRPRTCYTPLANAAHTLTPCSLGPAGMEPRLRVRKCRALHCICVIAQLQLILLQMSLTAVATTGQPGSHHGDGAGYYWRCAQACARVSPCSCFLGPSAALHRARKSLPPRQSSSRRCRHRWRPHCVLCLLLSTCKGARACSWRTAHS